ncbi:MAG: HU family DNA-binding protein [Candidatus Electryonea clarkiae]|nr:HU family DNA-binding protein [Candidatus Electryonea clarkiae]MDP8288365.1 HU family DNA-binding protein [Candidatus Electryonea clarkiae]
MTMTKADITKSIAQGTGLTLIDVAAVVDGMLETLSDELEKGGRIEMRGFGTFKVDDRAERNAVNPRTGEGIHVPAKKVPVFKASMKLKDKVNK